MKIVQMIYSLSSGGAEKFVVDLSNELSSIGHEIILLILLDDVQKSLIFNRQFLSLNVRFHSMGFDQGFSLVKSNKVERFLQDEQPDIVHCHLNVIPYIYQLALTSRKIHFFHTLHNVTEKASGASYQHWINRFFYKKNLIHPVCISRLCQASYQRFYHLNNATYINNGRAFLKPTAHINEVKKEVETYKLSVETLVFIHVARCHKQKNQQLLIDSFNVLNKNGVDFILLMIGSGYDSLEGKVIQASACDKIHFLGEKDNVNDYMMCSDAFCLSSQYEGLPISLLEAFSYGLTPICTPVGGIPDVITDGVNGYLSCGMDVKDYVNAIKRFMDNPMECDKQVSFYKDNYSMDVCAKEYEKLFEDSIQG